LLEEHEEVVFTNGLGEHVEEDMVQLHASTATIAPMHDD